MVEVNIYRLYKEVDSKCIESAFLLKGDWFGPRIFHGVDSKKFLKKSYKAIVKEGKRLAKKKNLLRDISAVITSHNESGIGWFPSQFLSVNFYSDLIPKIRYLNSEA